MRDLAPFAFLGAVLLAGVALALAVDAAGCYARWSESDLEVHWTVWGGCVVSEDGRRWIPAANYREVTP